MKPTISGRDMGLTTRCDVISVKRELGYLQRVQVQSCDVFANVGNDKKSVCPWPLPAGAGAKQADQSDFE